MFNKLINLERKSILFLRPSFNISVTGIASLLFMMVAFNLPEKNWLVIFYRGINCLGEGADHKN